MQIATTQEGLPSRRRLRSFALAALERPAQLTLRLVDKTEGRRLNRDYRGIDKPTNVLSFGYQNGSPGAAGSPLAGDIVLCAPVVAAEAREQGKQLEAHYAHLIVHGVLHLQGYDHERAGEAAAMEARETEIVMQLGYPDPYCSA